MGSWPRARRLEDDEDPEALVPPAGDPSWEPLCQPLLEALDAQRMTFEEIGSWGAAKGLNLPFRQKWKWRRVMLRQMLAWLSWRKLCDFRNGYWSSAKSPERISHERSTLKISILAAEIPESKALP